MGAVWGATSRISPIMVSFVISIMLENLQIQYCADSIPQNAGTFNRIFLILRYKEPPSGVPEGGLFYLLNSVQSADQPFSRILAKQSLQYTGRSLLGSKGTLALAAAGSADSGEILAGTTGSVLARVTAGLAALGLVLEAALSVELLLTGGENELVAALFAH